MAPENSTPKTKERPTLSLLGAPSEWQVPDLSGASQSDYNALQKDLAEFLQAFRKLERGVADEWLRVQSRKPKETVDERNRRQSKQYQETQQRVRDERARSIQKLRDAGLTPKVLNDLTAGSKVDQVAKASANRDPSNRRRRRRVAVR